MPVFQEDSNKNHLKVASIALLDYTQIVLIYRVALNVQQVIMQRILVKLIILKEKDTTAALDVLEACMEKQ
jgi:hypothetical protein